jgi:hypothetical protein
LMRRSVPSAFVKMRSSGADSSHWSRPRPIVADTTRRPLVRVALTASPSPRRGGRRIPPPTGRACVRRL